MSAMAVNACFTVTRGRGGWLLRPGARSGLSSKPRWLYPFHGGFSSPTRLRHPLYTIPYIIDSPRAFN
jgi:hypothetical protein